MRIVTYQLNGSGDQRVGEVVGDRVKELAASSMIAWLSGEGKEATGTECDLADVELLAPVPQPPTYRDFMNFLGHAERASRNLLNKADVEIDGYWYEKPCFYFGNPSAFLGPGAPVKRPDGVEWLDFELELGVVVGADEQVAGFTILNDWSARDVQVREVPLGMGPHKSKDFATSLGPWLVTPDELPFEGDKVLLQGRVEVNGEVVTETSNELQQFTFEEMRRAAGEATRLCPGDVFGTGTLDMGTIAEFGPPEEQRWLQPGDTVTLVVDGLGELQNTIA